MPLAALARGNGWSQTCSPSASPSETVLPRSVEPEVGGLGEITDFMDPVSLTSSVVAVPFFVFSAAGFCSLEMPAFDSDIIQKAKATRLNRAAPNAIAVTAMRGDPGIRLGSQSGGSSDSVAGGVVSACEVLDAVADRVCPLS